MSNKNYLDKYDILIKQFRCTLINGAVKEILTNGINEDNSIIIRQQLGFCDLLLDSMLEAEHFNNTIDSSYYSQNKNNEETIDIIYKSLNNDFKYFTSYCVGNVIKYISRFKYKYSKLNDQLTDIAKAQQYLKFIIRELDKVK